MKRLAKLAAPFFMAALIAGCSSSAAPASNSSTSNQTDAAANQSKTSDTSSSSNSQNSSSDQNQITVDKAKEIALAQAGLKAEDVTFVNQQKEFDDGVWQYEIEFYSGNTEYDYTIAAADGAILAYDTDAESFQAVTNGQASDYITEQKAIDIALNHAGVSQSQTSYLHAQFDYDDGRAVYDIEWRDGATEYSYEINAVDGSVISFDKDYFD